MKRPISVSLIATVLAAMTFAVFSPLRHAEFINYDDPRYVTENPMVPQGLTWTNVKWAFTTEYFDNWHPLAWLSHMLDCSLFGLNSGAHHLMNVLYHTLNVVILFLVLRQLTGATWRSALAAALFAVHPLRVESVAWIAERKDLLSTLFGLLSIGAYARYVQKRSWPSYAGALVLFALALMAKPMVVTLPCVLLLLDFWPLQRLHARDAVRIISEKLPFFLLSILSSIETLHVQYAREMASLVDLTISERLENAAVAYSTYVSKTFWPAKLGVFYPHPGIWPAPRVAAGVLFLLGGTVFALLALRKRPYFFVGWFWFLGTLVPVIGIIQVAGQAFADRYTYLSSIGLLVLVVWGFGEICARFVARPAFVALAVLPVLAVNAALTGRQLKYWQNSGTLFAHTLEVTDDNVVAHTDYAATLMEEKRYEDALLHYEEAVRLDPTAAKGEYNMGFVLAKLGRNAEAIEHFHRAINNDPKYAAAWTNLGNALLSDQKADEAMASYQQALRVKPEDPDANYSYGNALMHTGKLGEAADYLRAAIRQKPNYVQAHNNLGIVLTNLQQLDEATEEFRETLRLDPKHLKARYNLASILAREGKFEQAITEFQESKRLADSDGQADFARTIQSNLEICEKRAAGRR